MAQETPEPNDVYMCVLGELFYAYLYAEIFSTGHYFYINSIILISFIEFDETSSYSLII